MPTEQQENTAIERVRDRMHRRYDQAVVPGEVDQALTRARHRFDGCPVRTYVPILVERGVRAELDHRSPQPV